MATVQELLDRMHKDAEEQDKYLQSVQEEKKSIHTKKTARNFSGRITQDAKEQAVSQGIELPRASTSPLSGLTMKVTSPQQFARDFAYGTERLAAAGLGALEGVSDILGAGFGKAVQGVASLGGLAPNPVSEWGRDVADYYLTTSPTQEYEESIRRRYNPSRGMETVTGVEQAIAQMLPGIGAARAVSAVGQVGNALNAAQAAQRGANAGRALFGLQAAGQSAQEAKQEGATTNQALAYGAASGLLESAIEGVAGGIPGLGQGVLDEAATALARSPVLNRAADIAGEGAEEALSTAVTPYLQRAMYNPEAENATPEEILQSAALGSLAAGVLQGGLELPGAVSRTVSDIRDVRQAVGSNQDIINRANQRIQQDITARAAAANPLLTMLPTVEELQARQAGSPAYQRDMRLRLPGGEQQNTASTAETVNENGLTALTDRERVNLSSGKRNKIVSTFQDAVSFVRNALSDRQNTDRAYLGKVPETTAQKVLSDTGINITGYNAVIPSGAVRHIFNRHGDANTEASLGQRAVTPEDVARIPNIISDPDRVTLSSKPDANGRTALLFEKDLGDIFVTVQAVSDGTHSIQADTMYIRKKNSQDTVSDNGASAPPPNRNVRNVPPQSSSVISILPGGREVNRQSMAAEDIAPMPLVLPGGAARGSIDNLARPGYDGDTQNGQIGGVTYGRGEEATSAREGIYGTSLQEEIAGPEETHRGRMERVLEESGRAQQPESWAQGHVISTPSAQAQSAASQARKYSRDVFVVDDAALKSRNENAWAVTSGGKIYISDSVPKELADVVGYHESIHAIRQQNDEAYHEFLSDESRLLNRSSEISRDLLDLVVDTRFPGKSIMELTPEEAALAYDELNALVWGYHKADPENARAQFSGVFYDYDAYIGALDAIMEGAATSRREPSGAIPLELPYTAPSDPAQGVNPESSVGAAPAGFDPWSHFQATSSEFFPEGANAARDVDVPTTDPQGRRIRKTAATAMGAKAIPDEAVADIQNMVLRGELSYDRASDKKSIERAVRTIQDKGYQGALEEFRNSVSKGVVSKDIATLGQQLLINAANAGDGRTTAELLTLYAQMETSAGQAVQAASILRKLAPSDQLYAAQRTVSELEKTIRKNYKDLEITIDPSLIEEFGNQTTQEGRDQVLQKIYQNVADQIPSTWKDKWNAWRYLAMLGNPRTHIRNIAGNVFFQPLRIVKDRTAAAIESGVSLLSGGQLQRTKSFAANPDLYKAAWNDWDNVRNILSGNKYDDIRSEINSRRRIFRAKPLELARTGNSWLLEFEDTIFKRITYADALAGYLQANGVTAEQIRSSAAPAETRKTASEETVVADTSLFDRGVLADLNQARKSFIAFARSHFPTSVQNVETGNEIKISRNGLDKFLSGRLPYEKYATGFHIPELVERAHKVGEAGDVKGRVDITGYEYYEAPISVDGKNYMAYIRVRNTTSGDSYYGHTIGEVENIEIEPSARADTKNVPRPVYAIDSSISKPTIPQTGGGVNLQPAPGGRGSAKSSTARPNYSEIERPTRTSAPESPAVQSENTGRSTSKSSIARPSYSVNALPPELLARARDYAGREALRATYQDRNMVSDKVVQVANVLGPAGEAILPFKRTPANILVRGLEYSPAGLAKALTADLIQVKRGNMTGAEAIDHIAAGLTGSALFALGAYLFSQGIVTSGGGDDENQDRLNELTGEQTYALNLPGGGNVTLDWLAPEALPFFMGVELMDSMGQSGNTTDSIMTALKSVSDPMLELSMLQSLNDVIDSVSFSENKLGALASSAVVSYFTQAIPTLGGQFERSGEETRMSTYTDKALTIDLPGPLPEVGVPTDVQYAIGRASARLPGWDYQQIPYIDAWGREESSGPLVLRAANNFLNPSYTSNLNVTPVDAEIQRIYDQTGDGGVVPERPQRYITVSGERVDLNAGQYVQYATERGRMQFDILEELIDRRAYQRLTDSEKAAVVSDVYQYADAVAKSEISDYQPDSWIAKVQSSGADPADYILYRSSLEDGMTVQEKDRAMEAAGIAPGQRARLLLAENPEWAEQAEELDIPGRVFAEYKVATAGLAGDKDENGNTISGSRKAKVLDAINAMDVDSATKDALYYAAGYAASGLGDAPWR